MRRDGKKPKNQTTRCAIYTRKSSEEGLDQEFNSLDAQREAAEAYILSQKTQGWTALPDRYDDGGFSGGNMDRPAIDRLLRDIDDGKVDCVVVYKVDRLSRSLLDFARIMERFERHNVSFVSVTQQFNTTHSMGRLTLNILLSFAQFEREIIGERIRDKKAAQARKGKWTGGTVVLGYDVDRSNRSPRLMVNAKEASRVRAIFKMYLQEAALLPVVRELARRGWTNKEIVTRTGQRRGGRRFDKASLRLLLTNPIYIGKRRYKDELHAGEHEPIIDQQLFDKVQHQLAYNRRTGGIEVRNKYGALLRGLLRCKSCDTAMSHTFTRSRGRSFYRYYRCSNAMRNGHAQCPVGTIPAGEIERVVVEEVRGLARDDALFEEVLQDAQAGAGAELTAARRDRADLLAERDRHHKTLHRLVAGEVTAEVTARMAELQERITAADQRLPELDARIAALDGEAISPTEARAAFADFDGLWQRLIPREQARLLNLLISTVEYDGVAGTLAVTFRPTGIRSLIDRTREDAA